jgi:hypothetical protein
MPDEQNAQPEPPPQPAQVNEPLTTVWGGEPLNTSRNALSDKGENNGFLVSKEQSLE